MLSQTSDCTCRPPASRHPPSHTANGRGSGDASQCTAAARWSGAECTAGSHKARKGTVDKERAGHHQHHKQASVLACSIHAGVTR